MPDIENPQTFSEWYWRNNVDAQSARSLRYEQTLAPIAAGIIDTIIDIEGMPPDLINFLGVLKAPPAPDLDSVLIRFLGAAGTKITDFVFNGKMREAEYGINSRLKNLHITPDAASLLFLRKKIQEDFWQKRQLDAGYSDAEMRWAYETIKPYPNITEIIQYARYHDTPDNPKGKVWELFDVSETDYPIWEFLTRQKLNTEQVLTLWKQGFWNQDAAYEELKRIGWQLDDIRSLTNLAYILPNAMLLTQGGLMQELPENVIRSNIEKADIHPVYADLYLDGILTKPASTDIIAFELRRDPQLSNLSGELRKIGIHPAYHPLYRELAYPIPPVADIITMAVREAFTPDIAQRFGQYEGLPQAYVEAVQRKGISREWAERYWAAHWTLPSPQQGFEMLHRGIINRDELHLLLRALDIMPFWRDKLMATSFNPLTRVDIRRMYNLGVLSEAEVHRSYLNIGYDDTNAARLTQFTVKLLQQQKQRAAQQAVKQAVPEIKLWTQAQTLKFLAQKLITEDRAVTELRLLGYSDERISVYLKSVPVKTG